MHIDQLRTLVAVVDAGTFEAAARALSITPSAVSQRVKALESDAGRLLVRRTVPCEVTADGAVLLRTARQMLHLEDEARSLLEQGGHGPLAVAVNADSLATWFRHVLADLAGWDDIALHLVIADEGQGHELLRSGEVVGAISSHPSPVGGCRLLPLGTMRYLPVATPALRERHSPAGRLDWSAIPALTFGEDDALQADFLADRGVSSEVVHRIPSSDAFLAAVRAGLGWGLLPEEHATGPLESKELVRLAPGHVDVALHWQVWGLRTPRVARLTEAVRRAAEGGLRG